MSYALESGNLKGREGIESDAADYERLVGVLQMDLATTNKAPFNRIDQ
jgi:hypothetical protein